MPHFHVTSRPTNPRNPHNALGIEGDGMLPGDLHRGPSHGSRAEALAILEDIRDTMRRAGFRVTGSQDLGYLGIGDRVTLAYELEECHGPDCGPHAVENVPQETAGEAFIQI